MRDFNFEENCIIIGMCNASTYYDYHSSHGHKKKS